MKVCSIKVNPKRLIKHKNSDLMDIFRKIWICVAAGVNGLTAQQIHRLHSFGVVVEAPFPPIQEGDQDQTVQGSRRHNTPAPRSASSLPGDKVQRRRLGIFLVPSLLVAFYGGILIPCIKIKYCTKIPSYLTYLFPLSFIPLTY